MKYCFVVLAILLHACAQQDETIKIKGSDTEVNLAVELAESFHGKNPNVFVSISGGGSGLGIASLLNNTADVANSSRSINAEEMALFKKNKIQIDSFIFAQDAIAFVVAKDLPIDSISTRDLAAILSGKYPTWKQLAKKNLPVNIYGRQSNSGTHDFVKDRLSIEFSRNAKEMNGNGQILEAIRADHSGIGYVGAGYVSHGASKALKILPVYTLENKDAISPLNAKKIADGKYFFQRPLFQYYKAVSYSKIKPFLDYEKSQAGQSIIHSAGYYPLRKL